MPRLFRNMHFMWQHDVAQRMKIRRHALADQAGMDESYDVGPAFPQIGPDQVHYHSYGTDSGKVGTGGLAKLAIGAALATGLGGVGLGALSLLNSDPEEKVIEKIIPGENTDVEIKPGDMIFE